MKQLILSIVLLGLGSQSNAQQPTPSAAAANPTTRVLAIGHLTASATRDKFPAIMPREVKETVDLYLAGKIDQWFARNDQNGVVFLMNVSSVEEARALLEALPLGKAKLMEFELIPVGPLTPLRILNGGTMTPVTQH